MAQGKLVSSAAKLKGVDTEDRFALHADEASEGEFPVVGVPKKGGSRESGIEGEGDEGLSQVDFAMAFKEKLGRSFVEQLVEVGRDRVAVGFDHFVDELTGVKRHRRLVLGAG